MKTSNAILILIVIVVGIIVFQVVNNRTKSINETFGNNVGAISSVESLNAEVKHKKDEEQKKILYVGGGIILAFIVVLYFFKSSEDKQDPIKNLESLKNNSIISQEEYDRKVIESKEIEQRNKIRYEREKESKKLIAELENLKEKGIISEIEFEQKLKIINEKIYS